ARYGPACFGVAVFERRTRVVTAATRATPGYRRAFPPGGGRPPPSTPHSRSGRACRRCSSGRRVARRRDTGRSRHAFGAVMASDVVGRQLPAARHAPHGRPGGQVRGLVRAWRVGCLTHRDLLWSRARFTARGGGRSPPPA